MTNKNNGWNCGRCRAGTKPTRNLFLFLFFASFVNENVVHYRFQDGDAAKRELLSGEVDLAGRWGNKSD